MRTRPDASWGTAEAVPRLLPDEIHVWREPLDLPASRQEALQGLLSAEEVARAARFRFAVDRARYAACRGRLRELLGAYAGAPPRGLRFVYGEYGKPALAGSPLAFNVSHAAGFALVAVARHAVLGIDIEEKRDDVAFVEVSRAVFSPGERAALESLPEAARKDGFYRAWTRKEAFIKAVGQGVAYGLDRFDVSLRPGEPPALLRVEGDAGPPERWTLVDLAPGEPFAGALAVEGRSWRIRLLGR